LWGIEQGGAAKKEEVELRPDGWDRFNIAVNAAAKSGPMHRTAKLKKRAKHQVWRRGCNVKRILFTGAIILAITSALAQSSKEECVSRLSQAQKAGIIYSFIMDGLTPNLVVDEGVWNKIDFGTKVGMAETTMCALLGPGQPGISVKLNFRSHLTNRIIGEWQNGQLTVH
jgi:hypothetical protein